LVPWKKARRRTTTIDAGELRSGDGGAMGGTQFDELLSNQARK
jgi:hypothetical protein